MPETEPAVSFDQAVERLRSNGFQVTELEGGRVRVQKGACAAVLERFEGGVRFAEQPGYVIGQYIARLEDRGYQKYLWTPQRSWPALAEHLMAIHRFGEELKAVLDLKSLYNESLGTVSDRYLYDRVYGREGPRKP